MNNCKETHTQRTTDNCTKFSAVTTHVQGWCHKYADIIINRV